MERWSRQSTEVTHDPSLRRRMYQSAITVGRNSRTNRRKRTPIQRRRWVGTHQSGIAKRPNTGPKNDEKREEDPCSNQCRRSTSNKKNRETIHQHHLPSSEQLHIFSTRVTHTLHHHKRPILFSYNIHAETTPILGGLVWMPSSVACCLVPNDRGMGSPTVGPRDGRVVWVFFHVVVVVIGGGSR